MAKKPKDRIQKQTEQLDAKVEENLSNIQVQSTESKSSIVSGQLDKSKSKKPVKALFSEERIIIHDDSKSIQIINVSCYTAIGAFIAGCGS